MAIVILQILMDLKGKDPVEVAEAISEESKVSLDVLGTFSA